MSGILITLTPSRESRFPAGCECKFSSSNPRVPAQMPGLLEYVKQLTENVIRLIPARGGDVLIQSLSKMVLSQLRGRAVIILDTDFKVRVCRAPCTLNRGEMREWYSDRCEDGVVTRPTLPRCAK